MGDNTEQPTKKRKFPWQKAYSMVSQKDVEKRIGITMMDLAKIAITPEDMLVKGTV